jgi:peptidoglycan/LPS O-acetylase OafA/YrhL
MSDPSDPALITDGGEIGIRKKTLFFPGIEALRAVAVFMTMMAHFIPKDCKFYVPYMWYGVNLFFSISGFLITYIFLKTIHSGNPYSKKSAIKNFFVRRILRLFPAYYLLIISFFLLKNFFHPPVWTNDYNFYFFTYLQNMYYFKHGVMDTHFSHLWSLGVEEQFYLVWPFLLLFTPRQWYPKLFLLLMASSILIRIVFQASGSLFGVLTVANLHTLSVGALLAYFYFFKPENALFRKICSLRIPLQILALALLILSINMTRHFPYLRVAILECSLAATTGLLVLNSVVGWPKFLDPVIRNGFVQQAGKISYGIYLYHLLVPVILAEIIDRIPFLYFIRPSSRFPLFIAFVVYTYLLALASYHLYETKFLKLKSKFNS